MANCTSLLKFLCTNTVTGDNISFVKKEIMELMADEWIDGYLEAERHRKRREKMVEQRRGRFMKKFLDFLYDIQRGSKKKDTKSD
jgi:hypothetical protein